jgi:hypothetical protein
MMRHAVILFLWTSSPAQCVKITSILYLPWCSGLAGYLLVETLPYVLDFHQEAGDTPWCLQVSGSS